MPLTSLRTRTRLAHAPLIRNTLSRTMSNVAAFVAAAERADPSLVGASDKDKAAIAKLAGETEKLSKDLPVSWVWMSGRPVRSGTIWNELGASFENSASLIDS